MKTLNTPQRLAIPALSNDDLDALVSPHFGHCPYFVIVDVGVDGSFSVLSEKNPFAEKHAPGQIPTYLGEKQVQTVLASGAGGAAIAWFARLGIDVKTRCTGTVRSAIDDYLAGKLGEAEGCGHEHHAHDHSHEQLGGQHESSN